MSTRKAHRDRKRKARKDRRRASKKYRALIGETVEMLAPTMPGRFFGTVSKFLINGAQIAPPMVRE